MPNQPLVLTAVLPPAEEDWLNAWRTEFFPPHRNVLRAHLTLFHALPGDGLDAVAATLADLAARTAPLPARASGLQFLGAGVAVRIESAGLVALREDLAASWAGRLTAQDRQRLRPHVTVCNKVGPERAREIERELAARFTARDFVLPGLGLFRYVGGPWQALRSFAFAG